MGLETAVNINDLVPTNPTGADPKSAGDDHIRNIKLTLKNGFAGFPGAICVGGTDGGVANAYTLTPSHALPAYGLRMTAVFAPTVANTGPCTLNVSGLGVKALVSVAGAPLVAGDLTVGTIYSAFYDGAQFRLTAITKNYADQLAFTSSLPALSPGFLRSDGTAAAFTTTHTGYAVNEVLGAPIASAATIDLTAATGNMVHVTGTTAIIAITIPIGAERTVIFDGALVLTHGAGLLLPGAANIATAVGDRMVVRGDTGGAVVIGFNRASGAPVGPGPYLHVRDEKPSGTPGGASTASDITQTRTLNTVKANTISGASLAASVITLPAGTYDCRIRAPFASVGASFAMLYNSTDAAIIIRGGNGNGNGFSGSPGNCFVVGRFTLDAAKNLTVRHYTGASSNDYNLGVAISTLSLSEIHTEAEFWKVA